MPEIALVGRSNVGKSSLINHLLRKKGLAKTSSTPGKTQMLNFFSVDDQCALVDLPGYGYTKSGKNLRASWGSLIGQYLEERAPLSLIILLLDLRHLPSKDDIAFIQWASHGEKPLLIVFTKADKLTKSQQPLNVQRNLDDLMEKCGIEPPPFITFSVKNGEGRAHLIRKINGYLYGTD
jgi:GTP-binding protein